MAAGQDGVPRLFSSSEAHALRGGGRQCLSLRPEGGGVTVGGYDESPPWWDVWPERVSYLTDRQAQ